MFVCVCAQLQVKWGIDLQSEHERYLSEEVFKNKPLIVTDYPKASLMNSVHSATCLHSFPAHSIVLCHPKTDPGNGPPCLLYPDPALGCL